MSDQEPQPRGHFTIFVSETGCNSYLNFLDYLIKEASTWELTAAPSQTSFCFVTPFVVKQIIHLGIMTRFDEYSYEFIDSSVVFGIASQLPTTEFDKFRVRSNVCPF